MSTEYGYARISTPKQNIERQVRNILAAHPKAHIIREIFTGTKFQGRKELDKLLRKIKEGDTIIFDSVSRMSRNAESTLFFSKSRISTLTLTKKLFKVESQQPGPTLTSSWKESTSIFWHLLKSRSDLHSNRPRKKYLIFTSEQPKVLRQHGSLVNRSDRSLVQSSPPKNPSLPKKSSKNTIKALAVH